MIQIEMGGLSKDLKSLGYERTEQESPFQEGATLWTNSYELVCDETGYIIRKGNTEEMYSEGYENDEDRCKYYNSEKVKLYGGFSSNYLGEDGIYGEK